MGEPRYLDYLYLVASPDRPIRLKPLRQAPEDYLRHHLFEVRGGEGSQQTSSEDVSLGTIELTHVLQASAVNNGVSLFEVLRAGSLLTEVASQVFDPVSETFSEDFLAEMSLSPMNLDFIYVPAGAWLSSAWGPSVIHIIAQHFPLCSFFVVGLEGAGAIQSVEVLARSKALTDLGFEQLESTPYFFLDLSFQLPDVPAHFLPQTSPKSFVAA